MGWFDGDMPTPPVHISWWLLLEVIYVWTKLNCWNIRSYMTCVCDVYGGQETYFHHNNYQTRHNALACPSFCRNNVRMKDPVMSVCVCVCGNSNWHLARLKWWPTSTDVGRSDMDDGLRDSIYLLLTLPLFQCVMMTAAVLLFFWPA